MKIRNKLKNYWVLFLCCAVLNLSACAATRNTTTLSCTGKGEDMKCEKISENKPLEEWGSFIGMVGIVAILVIATLKSDDDENK